MDLRKGKMGKWLVCVVGLCCILQLQLASAQSAEVQQLLLNVEKLAQLKQSLADMKKGYDALSQGYNKIRDISKGNFSLHEVFLDGLLAVNPELRKYRRAVDIVSYQVKIVNQYKDAYKRFRTSGNFTPAELEYMARVYAGLLDRSLNDLDELSMVLTATKLRMSDDERLEAIDRIYVQMREKYTFLNGFNSRYSSIGGYRATWRKDAGSLGSLYGEKQ